MDNDGRFNGAEVWGCDVKGNDETRWEEPMERDQSITRWKRSKEKGEVTAQCEEEEGGKRKRWTTPRCHDM